MALKTARLTNNWLFFPRNSDILLVNLFLLKTTYIQNILENGWSKQSNFIRTFRV